MKQAHESGDKGNVKITGMDSASIAQKQSNPGEEIAALPKVGRPLAVRRGGGRGRGGHAFNLGLTPNQRVILAEPSTPARGIFGPVKPGDETMDAESPQLLCQLPAHPHCVDSAN
jgi:hypothetical protein